MNHFARLSKGKLISNSPLFLFLLFLSNAYLASGQCNISSSNTSFCVGEPIVFSCNSPGSSNFNWNFAGVGTNTTSCNPSFVFTSPGNKAISLILKLSNGSNCTSNIVIKVVEKPIVKIVSISPSSQCFKGNQFCFIDSSSSGNSSDTLCTTIYVFDDGSKYTFHGKGPRNFCHSFQDPSGGVYGLTVDAINCNGCVTKMRYNAIAKVLPSIGLNFTSPQPKRCDSVLLCITNTSTLPLDSIKFLKWDWGDGQQDSGDKNSPSLWRQNVPNGICHKYLGQGPNKGSFDITLTVSTFASCSESFTYKTAATNIIIKPVILATYDSVCYSNRSIEFRLKDGPVIAAANPLYIFEQPFQPSNITRNWTGTHTFSGTGPFRISFSFTHTIPGCGRTVYDTILVLGPQTIIEGSAGGVTKFMDEDKSFQCIIKDTVYFTNISQFYHNDKNFRDDDSTLISSSGFNKPLVHAFSGLGQMQSLKSSIQKRGNNCIERIWDFGDKYCEPCTTDTRNNENAGKNCRYSKDSLPKHWYTPWDDIYDSKFLNKPFRVYSYNKDSSTYIFKNLWAYDSFAIVRDTVLYYGDNALAIKSKDSSAYVGMKKVKVAADIKGISRTYFNKAYRGYLPAGDTAYIDQLNGLPPIRFIGGRYLNVQGGTVLDIRSKTDKVLNHVWVEYTQDTIPLEAVKSGLKVWKTVLINGFKTGDSINPSVHRRKFYESPNVTCFNATLSQRDICHPMACESESIKTLSLFPATAKNLRKTGVQCLGAGSDTYGITFILDDSKPGCSYTWAEINFDTANNPNGWVPAIGKNLSPGQISMGELPPNNQPYQVPVSGYTFNGPPGSKFSKQYFASDVKDSINGYIHVGLITGSGIWPGANYPNNCQDTVYYRNFARFPHLDNSFRIVSVPEGSEYTKICKKDSLSLSLSAGNRNRAEDVKEMIWTLTSQSTGKYYNKQHTLSVHETYERFKSVHKDSAFLMHYLKVVKRSSMDNVSTTLDSLYLPIARINKWHTEADISAVFDIFKARCDAYKINVFELSPAEISAIIWNGKGSKGLAYTGSKGLIDTAGIGHKITFTTISDDKKILHFRDSSLLPIDISRAYNGSNIRSYTFLPAWNGFYIANLEIVSSEPIVCNSPNNSTKKVIVGFYANMNYMDTVICHSQVIGASPEFRYFEVYPEISFRLLDPNDYWRDRITEAGNANREGYTVHDLNKKDDNINIPKTIFGGYPYSITGMDNYPGKILRLSGGVGSIYFNKDTGDIYLIRTAASDSTGCQDTIEQRIYTTAARAKIKLNHTIVNCSHEIELFDSSYMLDPCKNAFGQSCDMIIKWTVNWNDNGSNSEQIFFNSFPTKLKHQYLSNGYHTITLKVETALGCISWDSVRIYLTGPVPSFELLTNKVYCIGEKVSFKNTSQYNSQDSSIWYWEFGDGKIGAQFQAINSSNDTMNNRYNAADTYSVILHHFYTKRVGNTARICEVVYPDTSIGQAPMQVIVIDCDTTGIHDVKALQNIRVYPNPAINSFTVESETAVTLLIFDARGVCIEKIFCDRSKTIDVSYLSKGIYILTTEQNQVLTKLIVQ